MSNTPPFRSSDQTARSFSLPAQWTAKFASVARGRSLPAKVPLVKPDTILEGYEYYPLDASRSPEFAAASPSGTVVMHSALPHNISTSAFDADDEHSTGKADSVCSSAAKSTAKSTSRVCLVLLVFLLLAALLPSVYFSIAGSALAFRNYFNGLSTTQKTVVANALWSQYLRLPVHPSKARNFHTNRSRPFDGISYSPSNAMDSACAFSREDVVLDVALLSSVTTKIHSYGTRCGQAEYILDAIQSLNLDMKLALGVWLTGNRTQDDIELASARKLLSSYPLLYFECVFVGNEVLFREDMTERQLISRINSMKAFAAENKINVRIGTSELATFFTPQLYKACDVVGVNILPFFAGMGPEEGAQWAADYITEKILPQAGKTTVVISEIGWPYSGGTYLDAVADPPTFQRFMDAWVCGTAKSLNISWYYFEAFDEPWKKIYNQGANKWETEWGIFGLLRNMKPLVTLPSC